MHALIRQTFLHSDAGASQGGWRGCKDSAWLATRKSQRRHGWGKGGIGAGMHPCVRKYSV